MKTIPDLTKFIKNTKLMVHDLRSTFLVQLLDIVIT